MSSSTKRTINHTVIKRWIKERDGTPAVVKSGHSREGSGILRIIFGEKSYTLEYVDWSEFFKIFEDHHLAFLYQEETTDGDMSLFFKFIVRTEDDETEHTVDDTPLTEDLEEIEMVDQENE